MSENILNEKEVLLQEEVAEDVVADTVAEDVCDCNANDSCDKANDDVLLKVENLCQYFKLGKSTLKAVNNVNFDIKRGEVFGLVGESGCGKTTTGRSIIKLYNCTSGNVYFEGRRICAGLKSYKDTKKEARKALMETLKANKAALAEKCADIKAQSLSEAEEKSAIAAAKKESSDAKKAELAKYLAVVKEENAKIKSAKHDHKKCDRLYAQEFVNNVKAEYKEKLANLEKGSPEYTKTLIQYAKDYNFARKGRLVTQIQMIFQDPIASLDPRMTVKEIISEGLRIRGIKDKKVIEEKVYEVLEKVGLVREHAGRYPHEFSGGQRQRIGVARSIIMQPKLIIADEPVSALDVSIQAQVINLLNDLRHELGLTILFVAHDLSVVKYFSDRIAVMYFGNMVELATSEELFKNPLHPYTKSLLSAIPLPDPVYEKTRTRIAYNPLADHDYSVQGPTFREVAPGHFVSCNDDEMKKYQEILNNNN